jgi:glucose/arabinose dehydrogenase
MRYTGILLITSALVIGCNNDDDAKPNPDAGSPGGGSDQKPPANLQCASGNGGMTLPPGFCATVFADNGGKVRQMTVTPTGRVFVAVEPSTPTANDAHVLSLFDADNDGVAEQQEKLGTVGGNGIAWSNGQLFVAPNTGIVRYDMPDGQLTTAAAPATVAGNWPSEGDHGAKAIAIVDNTIFINVGSPSNSCQVDNRALKSPGKDPCDELVNRAGVWLVDTRANNQPQTLAMQVGTGMRNTNALAVDPSTQIVWGAINGRDQLHENWPDLFTEDQDKQLPADEVTAVMAGTDRGWPYCYYDPIAQQMKLAPEYGGDGVQRGRCIKIDQPALALPAHAAVLSMAFVTGTQFPAAYRGGAFLANHGSRFDANATGDLHGYDVEYAPFTNGAPTGELQKFATGFDAGLRPLPDAAPHRPVGLAMMPDGSLLISDDKGGRIWRVFYTGT